MRKTQLFLPTDYSLVKKRQMATTEDVSSEYLRRWDRNAEFQRQLSVDSVIFGPRSGSQSLLSGLMDTACYHLLSAWGYNKDTNRSGSDSPVHSHQLSLVFSFRLQLLLLFCTSHSAEAPTSRLTLKRALWAKIWYPHPLMQTRKLTELSVLISAADLSG